MGAVGTERRDPEWSLGGIVEALPELGVWLCVAMATCDG